MECLGRFHTVGFSGGKRFAHVRGSVTRSKAQILLDSLKIHNYENDHNNWKASTVRAIIKGGWKEQKAIVRSELGLR